MHEYIKEDKLFVDYTEIKDMRGQVQVTTSGKGFIQRPLYNFYNYSKGGDETASMY